MINNGRRVPDASIRIAVHPRIHVGLISVHQSPPRRNGGVGFSLCFPGATLTFSASDTFKVVDQRDRPLHSAEIARLVDSMTVAKAALKLGTAFAVDISGVLATHVGMGSGTSIRLACIEALLALNDIELPRHEIVRLSQRGGTSGIGINTYFNGGLILDLGVRDDGAPYLPSASVRPQALPLSLPPLVLPDWEVCLLVPRSIPAKSQQDEADFFKRTLPLTPEVSYRACYEALFGVYASILEQDALAFATSIERMQQTEWKSREWQEYGSPLTALRDEIRALGADYIGMSSLGPMLFAGGPTGFSSGAQEAADALDCGVFVTRMSNAGRTVEQVLPCDR